ncbi:MAG: F0F1 ATP synthase subunit B [Flavobacteriaceae bacterium]|jgi:F-type H+-transporting ATPase subunit b
MEKLISEFSFGLFFWQLFIFVGLVLLLKKYAWKPILDTVNERESSIKDALSAAAAAREEMENLQADNQRILKEARAERDTLLKEARTTSNQIVEQAKAEAKKEADKIMQQTQEAIANEKAAAVEDLKRQVAGFSLDIAEQVLRSELESESKQKQLVEKLLSDVKLK